VHSPGFRCLCAPIRLRGRGPLLEGFFLRIETILDVASLSSVEDEARARFAYQRTTFKSDLDVWIVKMNLEVVRGRGSLALPKKPRIDSTRTTEKKYRLVDKMRSQIEE
jgi:hypothetical protein